MGLSISKLGILIYSLPAQIKTMLTYCVRGERLCDGHWAAMIEGGQIRRLLLKLVEIGSKKAK